MLFYNTEGSTSTLLKWARVPLVSYSRCNFDYPGKITPAHVCTDSNGGIDTCQGDSGGPLICKGKAKDNVVQDVLAGVVSYGRECENGYAGVFTGVSYHHDFIEKGSVGYTATTGSGLINNFLKFKFVQY